MRASAGLPRARIMRVFERKGWFRIAVPEGWEVEEMADGPAAIFRRGGVGTLQVSAQDPRPLRRGEQLDVALLFGAYLRGIGVDPGGVRRERFRRGGAEWAAGEYVEEDPGGGRTFWRLWMAAGPRGLAFLTYACPEPDRHREREAVEEIVATLALEGTGPEGPGGAPR